MNNALSAARLSAVSDELDTIPGRVRWILANRINPHTQAPWKGNELGRAVLAKSPAHVNMIARGEIKEPSQDLLRAIAQKVGVSESWLILGNGYPVEVDDRPVSTTDSSTPHMVNAIGFADALAEAKRRAPGLHDHAWKSTERAAAYVIRGPVQPEDLVKLARVAEELADPGRIAAALDDQARRIAELEAELEAERAAKSAAPAKGRAKSTK